MQQRSSFLYDRNGEEHYNIISALHKAMRGSDADAALYWVRPTLLALFAVFDAVFRSRARCFAISITNDAVLLGVHQVARMMAGGEEPRYIARRLIRFASEDIGMVKWLGFFPFKLCLLNSTAAESSI